MGCQEAAESCVSSMLASHGHKGVRLGHQVNLLLPGSLIIASKWPCGEAGFQSRKQQPVLTLTLGQGLPPDSSFPFSHTFLRQE